MQAQALLFGIRQMQNHMSTFAIRQEDVAFFFFEHIP
jgi:hypothetical protein